MGYNNSRDTLVEEKKDDNGSLDHKSDDKGEICRASDPEDGADESDKSERSLLGPGNPSPFQAVASTQQQAAGSHHQQQPQQSQRPLFNFGDPTNQQPNQQNQQNQQEAMTSQQVQVGGLDNMTAGGLLDRATQQLLEQAIAQQRQQQPAPSLGPLPQTAPSLAPLLGAPSTFSPMMGMLPFNNQGAASAQLHQQVLAQQQAAAHAAALSIGTVASTQTQQTQQQAFSQIAPSVSSMPSIFSTGAPVNPPNMLYPAFPTPVLSNPASQIPGMSYSANPAANPIASLASGGVAALANVIPTRHLSPQHTIPHYVPPIPPTWGAQIPALTVQDRPLVPPIYNGINPNYPGAQMLHSHPPIFAVENFLTPAECDFLIEAAGDALGPAPVVGKGAGEVSPSRTSSTCYLAREDLPEYLRKVSLLTGKPAEHCELPQVGRYLPSQQYLQHFDAFDLSNEDGRRFAANGGQRTVTVLVYLNDVARGGATAFPNLNIEVQPRRGMAIVFFPSTLDGLLDKMALHAALPAVDTKYVSQVWIRQTNYDGRPSKRLAEPMVAGLQERRANEQRAQAQLLMGQLQLHHQQLEYQHQMKG